MELDMRKQNILYVAPSMSSFIRQDISALSEKYNVIVNTYTWTSKILTPWYMFLQILFILMRIKSVQGIIVSFGGYWSLIPASIGKLAKVPVAIILNGADCASIPPLSYGSLRGALLRYCCELSYKMATVLLPVSSSLVYSKNTYHSYSQHSEQGFLHFFPKLSTEYTVVSNGFDVGFWNPGNEIVKGKNSFIAVISAGQYVLKGGDLILEVADKFPSCIFYLAGLKKPDHLINVPVNVIFLGKLSPDELRVYYRKCQFYLQLSIYEGFGCALCEAMLCMCVPIGSASNVIPEIIENCGFILEKRDGIVLADLLSHIVEAKNLKFLGERSRQKVMANYPIEERTRKLINMIERFTNGTSGGGIEEQK